MNPGEDVVEARRIGYREGRNELEPLRDELEDLLDKKDAEIKRLRAGLQQIITQGTDNSSWASVYHNAIHLVHIARLVLAGKKTYWPYN